MATKTTKKEEAAAKKFRTLTEVLEAPAGESLATIAKVAAPIERIINGTGCLKLIFSETVATANDPAAMARLAPEDRERVQNEMIGIGADIIAVVIGALGDYMEECKEILAAVNGITVEELETDYTGFEIIKMVNALVRDQGFLLSVRTLLN